MKSKERRRLAHRSLIFRLWIPSATCPTRRRQACARDKAMPRNIPFTVTRIAARNNSTNAIPLGALGDMRASRCFCGNRGSGSGIVASRKAAKLARRRTPRTKSGVRRWCPGGFRQRGRIGGRGGAGRGRRWCRGSGGGTKRKTCPQEGQFSEPTSSARIQFPFDSQDGFIHWTVDPGMSGMSTLLVWPSLTDGSESPEG